MAEFIGANNGMAGTVTGVEGEGEAQRIIVSASGISLRCRSRSSLEQGVAVIAYVRPENIVVLDDGDARTFDNVVDGKIDRVIFEGPSAQLRVDVGGREVRADVTGNQRLTLVQRHGQVRLGFNDVTVIANPAQVPAAPPPT